TWDGTGNKTTFWDPTTVPNTTLHCSLVSTGHDLGTTSSLIHLLILYAQAKRNLGQFDTTVLGGTYKPRDCYNLAKSLLDCMWTNFKDSKGITTPEARADYKRMGDPVYIPSIFTGTMPNGDAIGQGATFHSLRSFYHSEPGWP